MKETIFKILQESPEPLGPSEISKQLKIPKNTIQYHLNNLKKEGKISSEKGKYFPNKTELKNIEVIENKVINLLFKEELCPNEIQQKLGFDEGKICSALATLEIDGLIKEGPTSITKRGGYVKTGHTFHDTKYFMETKYTLTDVGYSMIGICTKCKNEIKDKDLILTAFFRPGYTQRPGPWKKVLIHTYCTPDSDAYDNVYGKNKGPIFCEYCGLPLSPKMLPKLSITYNSIKSHFFELELKPIGVLEYLKRSCTKRSDFSPVVLKDKYRIHLGILNDKSTIEKAFKRFEIEIPEWISERLKNDSPSRENSSEDNIEPLSWKIHRDFLSLNTDLSKLSSSENFIKVLKTYRDDFPVDYDINSRIKEIWIAAQNIRSKNEENIQRMYEKLLGPAGSIHLYNDEAFSTEYDFDRQSSDALYDESSTFSQTITFKHGDKFYHPFCAEKLEQKDDDKNTKGGKNSEQKV